MLVELRMPSGLGFGMALSFGSEWSIFLLEKGAAEDQGVVILTLFYLFVHDF